MLTGPHLHAAEVQVGRLLVGHELAENLCELVDES